MQAMRHASCWLCRMCSYCQLKHSLRCMLTGSRLTVPRLCLCMGIMVRDCMLHHCKQPFLAAWAFSYSSRLAVSAVS